MTALRSLAESDIDATREVAQAAFADLEVRLHHPVVPWEPHRLTWFGNRVRHLLATDPGRQFALDDDRGLAGVALSVVRGEVWGLSLLVVRPHAQSAGAGRALLAAALAAGQGAPTGIICASDDTRALRAYAAAGFVLHPALECKGRADLSAYSPDPHVVVAEPDPELITAVDAQVRGGSHAPDLPLLWGADEVLSLRWDHDGERGYALAGDHGHVTLVAATSQRAATALLWRCLAHHVEVGIDTTLPWVTAGQPWAQRVAVAARLTLTVRGAVCWRGRPEPAGYLPNGSFL